MGAMAERMARGPARIQLKYKDPKELAGIRGPGCVSIHRRECRIRWRAVRLCGRHCTIFAIASRGMTIPVLLAVGDEDVPCLETNLMLKSALPNAGLWICPNTGHAINLEEPAAFNAQVENFLSAVERGSWRRGYPQSRD